MPLLQHLDRENKWQQCYKLQETEFEMPFEGYWQYLGNETLQFKGGLKWFNSIYCEH